MSAGGYWQRVSVLAALWLATMGTSPGDCGARRVERAAAAYQQGHFAASLRLYQEALVERPESAQLHFAVGDALYKTGDLEGALVEFVQAAAGSADLRAAALYNEGNVHLRQERPQAAIVAYMQALRLEPDDWNCKANLELALHMLGDQGSAAEPGVAGKQGQAPGKKRGIAAQRHPAAAEVDAPGAMSGSEPESEPTAPAVKKTSSMGREEAERLLDALRHRELLAQRHRFGPVVPVSGEDW